MREETQKIHEASMKILAETGVRFHHPEVIKLLEKHGIKTYGEVAYFKEDQVMEWVKKAPASFTLHARNPKYDMQIGGESNQFMAAYGAPSIIEADGTKRLAQFTDYIKFLKLVHQCEHFNINGGVLVQPSDLRADKSFPMMLYAAIIHSDKCLMGGPGGVEETKVVFDMLRIVFGEAFPQVPVIMTILNPSSPLQYDQTTLDTMLFYAKNRQPIIIAPAVMAGTTGPVTLAGTIALSNAETLAGVVVSQMINEGTPVLYGSASSIADMRTASFAIGAPESALSIAYCARLAKAYGLPSRGAGTLNDAKAVSVQSGYESMMQLLVGCQEGINFLLHSAGILDSYSAMSFEQYIVDLEIISSVKRFLAGVRIEDDTLALDVIKLVGPGGNFITSEHTLLNCRTEPWLPEISLRGIAEGDPNERIMEKINKKLAETLCNYEFPKLEASIKAELASYLQTLGLFPSNLAVS